MGAAGNPGEMGISESQEPFMRNKEAAAPAGIAAAGAARATVSLNRITLPGLLLPIENGFGGFADDLGPLDPTGT